MTDRVSDERIAAQVREEIARVCTAAMRDAMNTHGPYSGPNQGRYIADALLARWPILAGVDAGCRCGMHRQDAGGGYTEYEPSCPEHSEHLWNPRTGEWVLRERSVTDEMVEAAAVQREIDQRPCAKCGGDPLRPDYREPGLPCHVPWPEREDEDR